MALNIDLMAKVKAAESEYLQGWKFLEGGEKYIGALLLEYKGDLTQADHEQQARIEYIEAIDAERRKNIKNGVE